MAAAHPDSGEFRPVNEFEAGSGVVSDDVTYDEAPAFASYLDSNLTTGDRIVSDKFPLLRGSLE